MSRIRILDEATINRIAAGEVVEGPRSVVKELVENALDAGATRIEVELEGGGQRLVRVVDDGCGMDETDVVVALERHATSKLETAQDLHSISTMGFRGEAVPAIASVSRMTIVTRPHDASSGTKVEIAGGNIERVERAAAPPGTRIEVRHLFFNTPARRKFQKGSGAELAAIREMISDYLLARPDVAFKLRRGRETVLSTPGDLDLPEALERVLGGGEVEDLIPLEEATHPTLPFTISGYLARPSLHRGNSRGIRLFVNRRPFYSGFLCRAALEAYRNFLPKRRWPVAVFMIDCDPRAVDVNVHPTKKEVRFTGFEKLQEWLVARIRSTLEDHHELRTVSLGAAVGAAPGAQPGFWGDGAGPSEPAAPSVAPLGSGAPPAVPADPMPRPSQPLPDEGEGPAGMGVPLAPPEAATPRPKAPTHAAHAVPAARAADRPPRSLGGHEVARRLFDPTPYQDLGDAAPDLVGAAAAGGVLGSVAGEGASPAGDLFPGGVRVLGQVFDSFMLVTDEERLYYVDQHVAHERVLFEHFQAALREGEPTVQNLLIPVELPVTATDAARLEDRLGAVERHGFRLRVEGQKVLVEAYPLFPREVPVERILRDLVEGLADAVATDAVDEQIENLADLMSCKGAIKAGERMSPGEMQRLLERLFATRYPLTCPHGRPIILAVEESELRRRFLRSG